MVVDTREDRDRGLGVVVLLGRNALGMGRWIRFHQGKRVEEMGFGVVGSREVVVVVLAVVVAEVLVVVDLSVVVVLVMLVLGLEVVVRIFDWRLFHHLSLYVHEIRTYKCAWQGEGGGCGGGGGG